MLSKAKKEQRLLLLEPQRHGCVKQHVPHRVRAVCRLQSLSRETPYSVSDEHLGREIASS